jgi:PHD/YefM family antitoxin component YafN of YafNO toxin-antitoxin module
MIQIKPITELRDTSAISELCHKTDEPIFITKNGYGDMVLMSHEVFERMFALAELHRKLAAAEEDVAAGRVSDAEEVFGALRAKYGYKAQN